MSSMMDIINQQNRSYLIAGSAIGLSVIYIFYKKCSKGSNERKLACNVPKDTVMLFQIGRGPAAPSLSPFPLKLETFLRMAKIPYQNDLTNKMSPKGKTPFMVYNGVEVADSQFCIEYLNKKLGIDMNKNLTLEQRSIAHAFLKMTEENLYWTLALERWVYGDGVYITNVLKQSVPPFMRLIMPLLKAYVGRMVTRNAWGHGIGRHTEDEVFSIFKADIEALSDFIGQKQFLFGDDPCETDCALFGLLSQLLWHSGGSKQEKFMKEHAANLVAYCERMRVRFWPDWDDCITHNGTKTPVK